MLGRQGKGHSAHYLGLVTQAYNSGTQMWKQEDCHKFLVSLSYIHSYRSGLGLRCKVSLKTEKQTKQRGWRRKGGRERGRKSDSQGLTAGYQCGLRLLSSDLCRVREGFLPRLKEKCPDLYKHIMLCYGSLCVSIAKDLWCGNSQSLGSCVFIDNTFSPSLYS